MVKSGAIWAQWIPSGPQISGASNGGKVWVQSINSIKGGAIVTLGNRSMSTRMADLTQIARK